jgi:hypothetical protein
MVSKGAAMPNDPTPLGDAMTHRFPDQKIPGRKSGDDPHADDAPDISKRPSLPEHPQRMPADADADEQDPGAHGVRSLRKQRG